MTWMVSPIFVDSIDTALRHIRAARQAGAEALELRCDRTGPQDLETLLRHPQVRQGRVMVTVRSAEEGGQFTGSEEQRLNLLALSCRGRPDFVDVEWAAWQRSAQWRRVLGQLIAPWGSGPDDQRPRLIISRHDFSGPPRYPEAELAELAGVPEASILKMAFRARSVHDALTALRLYEAARRLGPRPLVSIAMDEAGQISRLLAGKFGAAFTFAASPDHGGTAPGQPRLTDLKGVYRLDRQRADWRVFGVVGWPIAHSLSPALHNAGFAALNFPGVYVPLPVAPGYESFAAAVDALRQWPQMNLGGLSITIPHKENAYRYLQERDGTMDPTASQTRALNTLLFRAEGSLSGLNSDGVGALGALAEALSIVPAGLSQYRVAVLGAGGAARGIVAALAACGASIVIYNRTLARAAELARAFTGAAGKITAAPLQDFRHTTCQIVINCTPVGMTPNVETLPLPPGASLRPDMVVFDTVYNPRETRLLRLARQCGARTVEGLEMLLRQAAVQFEGFTGQPAALTAMRQAVYSAHP